LRKSCFRPVAGVHEVLGHISEFSVEVLGRSAQYVERLTGGDPLTLHQDPLSLSDHLASGQGGVETFCPAFLVLVGAGG
jgi:hypothetical protein